MNNPNTTQLIRDLLSAGRKGDFASINHLPGAGDRFSVSTFSFDVKPSLLEEISHLPIEDRIGFAKAVAVYENTIGGVGSHTALQHVLRIFTDNKTNQKEGLKVLDWIMRNTDTLWHYQGREKKFLGYNLGPSREALEKKHYELAAPARARRAARATENLFNAVRRGDVKAVAALLRNGASANTTTPDGEPLIEYAERNGRADIADLLRNSMQDKESNGSASH